MEESQTNMKTIGIKTTVCSHPDPPPGRFLFLHLLAPTSFSCRSGALAGPLAQI